LASCFQRQKTFKDGGREKELAVTGAVFSKKKGLREGGERLKGAASKNRRKRARKRCEV